MKQLTNLSNSFVKYLALAALLLSQTLIWAQETTTTTKEVDVDLKVDDGGGEWYVQPWAWIVGAAVFILLVIALARGGKK